MKNTFLHIGIFSLATIFTACSNDKEATHDKDAHTEEKTTACKYAVDPASIHLAWTSFKHNEKTPVGGVFDMMELDNIVASETPAGAFKSATISINTRTINSNNEVRDEKIKNSFFGSMEKTKFLTGKIVSLDGENQGNATIAITMNGIEKEQAFEWKIQDEKVVFTSALNIEDWNTTASLDSLNTVCEDLHKGADGVSKLWSVVEVEITADLKKECE